MRVLLLTLVLLAPAYAQTSGTTPRGKPGDYPVSVAGKGFTLGAEYMVRSFGQHNQMFTTDDYLVVEVAVFPEKGQALKVTLDQFRLKINGKDPLHAQLPQMVAGSLRYPDWEHPRGLQTEAGVGPVVLGRRPYEPRFPGDTRRAPRQPTPIPTPDHENKVEKEPQFGDVAAVEFALPEGVASSPLSGYIYFAHKGKASRIKTLELHYRDADGALVKLKLF